MAQEIQIPTLGESVVEAVIARWHKKDGDTVAADEVLLELETEKASVEVPAAAGGTLRVLKPEGATVKPGDVVGRIEAGSGAVLGSVARPRTESAARMPGNGAPSKPPPPPPEPQIQAPVPRFEVPATPSLSPSVRRAVAEHAVDPTTITGTGRAGRITKADVLEHVAHREEPPPKPRATLVPIPLVAPDDPDVRREPMTPLRRRIAQRLVDAQHNTATLTTFNEVDMTAVLALRSQYKARFEEKHGVPLGFMSLFGRAAIGTLKEFPGLNAQIDGNDIVQHRRVHLGIAVSTPRGLIVPVVRNADRLTLAELERSISELAALARAGKSTPDQLTGGTFTISNGGVYGSLLSTPIFNPPQSGVLGMHKIQERAVVIAGQVVARPMMYLALSYDHRLVDGEQAVKFLVGMKERVEDPSRMLLGL